MGYRGYTESIEVLIDILDEQRKQTALLEQLLPQKEVKEEENEQQIPDTQGKNDRQSRQRRGVHKQ